MRWRRSEFAAAAAALLLLGACGGRAKPDDQAFHNVATQGSTGAEVAFNATVLQEPQQVGTHEHLIVRAATGEEIEIDYNTDLGPYVPAHAGSRVVIAGRFYDDSGREGVDCTHAHTSSGCPYPGYIELAGTYYE